MPEASETTRLLDDIEARQQQVIEELDALLARIEAVIAEHSKTPAATAAPAVSPDSQPTVEDDNQPSADEAAELTDSPDAEPTEVVAAIPTKGNRRAKSKAA